MHISHIRERLRQAGAAPVHEQRLLRLWADGATQTKAADSLPRRLRETLPELEAELASVLTLRSVHPSEDGSERQLLGLRDGQAIESVLLPICLSP